ncbi:MAG: class I SAM-dependent methyltransferase [Myxococcota bacterium]
MVLRGISDAPDTEVRACDDCEAQFLEPMMTDAEEDAYYRDYYASQATRYVRRPQLEEVQAERQAHYQREDAFHRTLLQTTHGGAPVVVEIGPGAGGFARYAQSVGVDHYVGVDRSLSNRRFLASSFAGDGAFSFPANVPETMVGKADLVIAAGVLEHCRDPRAFMRSTLRWARTTGRLAFAIPNPRPPLIEIFDHEPFRRFAYTKQHPFTFSERSLECLGRELGLHAQFSYIQAWGLDNLLSWLRYGRPRDFSDISAVLSETTIRSFAHDMCRNRSTDLMWVVFERTSVERAAP